MNWSRVCLRRCWSTEKRFQPDALWVWIFPVQTRHPTILRWSPWTRWPPKWRVGRIADRRSPFRGPSGCGTSFLCWHPRSSQSDRTSLSQSYLCKQQMRNWLHLPVGVVEGHGVDHVFVLFEGEQFWARFRVPDLAGPIIAASNEPTTIQTFARGLTYLQIYWKRNLSAGGDGLGVLWTLWTSGLGFQAVSRWVLFKKRSDETLESLLSINFLSCGFLLGEIRGSSRRIWSIKRSISVLIVQNWDRNLRLTPLPNWGDR